MYYLTSEAIIFAMLAVMILVQRSAAFSVRRRTFASSPASDSQLRSLGFSNNLVNKDYFEGGLSSARGRRVIQTARRSRRNAVTVEDAIIRNIVTHSWDLRKFAIEAYDFYCSIMKDNIPSEIYSSCKQLSMSYVNAEELNIPKLYVYKVNTLGSKAEDMDRLLVEAFETLSKMKFVVANITTMEEDVTCQKRVSVGLPCKQCQGSSKHFWCYLMNVEKRLNALNEHLRLNSPRLFHKSGPTINIDNPSLTESMRMVYNFAALHRIVEQSDQTYRAFHFLLNL
ncbi:uncharacterized protein LOC141899991 [Tubulanus polymorphus]|uniref:uncharacterized protein LOC141899991 n=1 Tax=Tubulanus polymorphus TaxID=672921 RepID=UPI003DA33075